MHAYSLELDAPDADMPDDIKQPSDSPVRSKECSARRTFVAYGCCRRTFELYSGFNQPCPNCEPERYKGLCDFADYAKAFYAAQREGRPVPEMSEENKQFMRENPGLF